MPEGKENGRPTPLTDKVILTGTQQHLDPTTLLIGENVRDDAALDAHFLASVREHGVLQPVTAIRTDNGVEVRDGQRRTPHPQRRLARGGQ